MHRLRNGCTQRVLILLTWNISRRNTLISAQRNWAESWPRHQPEKLQESMVPWSCDILRQHQQKSPLLHNNKRTQTQQTLTTVVTFISVQNLQHCSNPQDAKTAAWILGIARLHLVLPNNFHWPKNACASSTQLMSCWLFERLCSRWTWITD